MTLLVVIREDSKIRCSWGCKPIVHLGEISELAARLGTLIEGGGYYNKDIKAHLVRDPISTSDCKRAAATSHINGCYSQQ
jgi:hypothetical protein